MLTSFNMNIVEQLQAGVQTRSPEETMALGEALASALERDCVLALSGDLGAGKSTFVRGLAKGWGIEQPLTSPTFNLYLVYEGQRQLVHLDAYRLSCAAEAEELLLEDVLVSPFCLAVEWPENIADYLPYDSWWLHFTIQPDQSHRIQQRAR